MIKNKITRWLIASLLILVSIILLSNIWIILSARDRVYPFDSLRELPVHDIGLVLGTSRYLSNGDPNPHFKNRIHAAAALFKAGKIKHILVSGSTQKQYYNEPQTMLEALQKEGIPDSVITMDPGGYRTINSIIRANKVFGLDSVTIISDRFHTYRAIFIANHHNLNAQAFACETVPLSVSFFTRIRELFARTLAIIDIYIFPPTISEKRNPEEAPTEYIFE